MHTPRTSPHHIAWLIFLVPVFSVHAAYAIGWWQGVAYECNPYLHGCTTISRAAREGDAIFLFRGLMMPLSMLLVFYWYLQRIWLQQMTGKPNWHIFVMGAVGALFLILYVNYLGTDGDFNRFMRRHGIIFYFGLTALAQLFSVFSLQNVMNNLDRKVVRYMDIQLLLIILCWIAGAVQVAIKSMGVSWEKEAENVIEWHFALYMSLHFVLTALMWRHTKFSWHFKKEKEHERH